VLTPHGWWSGDELVHRATGASAWLDHCGVRERVPVPALVDE